MNGLKSRGPVGAAEGCDQILSPIAAFGSSYKASVNA